MIHFISKRLFYGFLVVVSLVFLVFFLFDTLPGDPAKLMQGQRIDAETTRQLRHDMGLDKSHYIQLLLYLNDLSPVSCFNKDDRNSSFWLDPAKYSPFIKLAAFNHACIVIKMPYLRRSWQNREKVSAIISATIWNTLLLATTSMIFASLLGIFLGILAALNKDSFYDHCISVFSVAGMSAPSFFMGLLIAWLFGHVLKKYTGLNIAGNIIMQDDSGNNTVVLKNLILPAFTIGIRPLAVITQLTRNSMLHVLSQDYIRTAVSLGFNRRQVVLNYALKNAINPVLTSVSGWFSGLVAGALFVEYIFGWNGVGKEIIEALERYDLPVIMGIVLVTSVIFVIINIVSDIVASVLDPRIALV